MFIFHLYMNALIIQEDVIIREILWAMLKARKYSCVSLNRLEEVEAHHLDPYYDVLISDLLFSGITAKNYVLELKEVFRYEKLIIITALGQERVKRNISKLTEVKAYLDYPVKLELLNDLIPG